MMPWLGAEIATIAPVAELTVAAWQMASCLLRFKCAAAVNSDRHESCTGLYSGKPCLARNFRVR